MNSDRRAQVAAAATVVALGGIAGIALGQDHRQTTPEESVADSRSCARR